MCASVCACVVFNVFVKCFCASVVFNICLMKTKVFYKDVLPVSPRSEPFGHPRTLTSAMSGQPLGESVAAGFREGILGDSSITRNE